MTIPFPDDMVHDSVLRNLKPGVILYLSYSFFRGDPPEDKLFLVASIADDPPLLLKIRRELTSYAQANPLIVSCHLLLAQNAYTNTLKQDSYLDCTQVFNALSNDEVERQLIDDYSRIRDRLTKTDISQAIKMMGESRGISPIHMKLITKELGNVI